MSSLPRQIAPLFAGLVITACAGSTAVRGVTNMQPNAAPAAVTESSPALDCKGGSQHCSGDAECCSNLCIEQICTAPGQ
jgi:hypothetical protein